MAAAPEAELELTPAEAEESLVADVTAALESDEPQRAAERTAALHPADIADLFEQIAPHLRLSLARALGDQLDSNVFAEMSEWVRDALLEELPNTEVAEVIGDMDTDDAVAVVEELDPEDKAEVLAGLDAADRVAIEEALTFPEESAGRIMRRDPQAAPEHWTVRQAIDHLRAEQPDDTDFWELFVVDPAHCPVGTIRLSWLLTAPTTLKLTDVMQREQTLIPVEMDQEEVANLFQKYALISAAVTDSAGRLVGVITVDDILHIVQQEASEDILRLAGAGDESDLNVPIPKVVRVRLYWLVINLGTAILASSVVGLFQGAIERLVVLATLMPIVSGMGGNAGTQTLAVVVRALATGQLTTSTTRRAIAREMTIAAANGLALGTLIGLGVTIRYSNLLLGAVMGAAMLINNLVAGAAGVLIPVFLDRRGIDPAVSSAVFVTTMTDCMGFFSFLGLAVLTGLA
ncbi:MAG: magnesium transporter [Sphingomonadaceae bacterium]|nr:magnesium transporter [Sphingomonadaceae bacterium]